MIVHIYIYTYIYTYTYIHIYIYLQRVTLVEWAPVAAPMIALP